MRIAVLLILFMSYILGASHSFVVSKSGHHKGSVERKVVKKAESRALKECREHNATTYKMKPLHCVKREGKDGDHAMWNCMTLVTCFR